MKENSKAPLGTKSGDKPHKRSLWDVELRMSHDGELLQMQTQKYSGTAPKLTSSTRKNIS